MRPDAGVDVIVDADDPRRPHEQLGVTGSPTGLRGPRHRMAADEAVQQSNGSDLLHDARFHAGDVCERAFGRQIADAVQHL